jgi:hypothetical protein
MTPSKKIEIRWIVDSYDCETCGGSSAEGAIVTLNGEEILRLEPLAHCYNSIEFSQEDVYKKLLETLGYEVTEINP